MTSAILLELVIHGTESLILELKKNVISYDLQNSAVEQQSELYGLIEVLLKTKDHWQGAAYSLDERFSTNPVIPGPDLLEIQGLINQCSLLCEAISHDSSLTGYYASDLAQGHLKGTVFDDQVPRSLGIVVVEQLKILRRLGVECAKMLEKKDDVNAQELEYKDSLEGSSFEIPGPKSKSQRNSWRSRENPRTLASTSNVSQNNRCSILSLCSTGFDCLYEDSPPLSPSSSPVCSCHTCSAVAIERSKQIDSQLELDYEKLKWKCEILMDGDSPGFLGRLLLRINKPPYSTAELEQAKAKILKDLYEGMIVFLQNCALDQVGETQKQQRKSAKDLLAKLEQQDVEVTSDDGLVFLQLWESGTRSNTYCNSMGIRYLLNSIDRILSASYTPTPKDILHASYSYPLTDWAYTFTHLPSTSSNRTAAPMTLEFMGAMRRIPRKAVRTRLLNASAMLYSVDLMGFKAVETWSNEEKDNLTEIELTRFGYMLESRLLVGMELILLLYNVKDFKAVIEEEGVETVGRRIPCITAEVGRDGAKALACIKEKVLRENKEGRSVHVLFMDDLDVECMEKVIAEIAEILRKRVERVNKNV